MNNRLTHEQMDTLYAWMMDNLDTIIRHKYTQTQTAFKASNALKILVVTANIRLADKFIGIPWPGSMCQRTIPYTEAEAREVALEVFRSKSRNHWVPTVLLPSQSTSFTRSVHLEQVSGPSVTDQLQSMRSMLETLVEQSYDSTERIGRIEEYLTRPVHEKNSRR